MKTFKIFGWKFNITPIRICLLAITAISIVVVLIRMITGFGVITNLNDDWPWGLWISFDVLTGVALAGGGYSTALIVNILHRDRYHPIARGALVSSLLGYLLVMAGLFLDIGQWFNFWRPFISWGYSSVLFEVFWCISIYTTIQVLEFGEIVTEKIGQKFHTILKKTMPVLLIIGVIFPTLHQSSLGSLFLIAVHKMHPFWWSPLLPLFFLMSSFFVGAAMICVESTVASKAFHHKVSLNVLSGLAKISGGMMICYLALKVYDLASRNILPLVINGSLEANFLLAEIIIGVIIPIIIVFSRAGKTRKGLFIYGILASTGVVLNRMNVVFTAMAKNNGGYYLPSIWEFTVSVGLIAAGCLVYCFIVENFNIFGHTSHDQEQHRQSYKISA
ncbi:putative Ni/Fe-hydrogenase 2 b-type cytochrome subunit [bioreactor metagenome]|uniref:Putative Ni/Fe-hydrogenase 2 b-type cytochrome subunit n=1 Tax=bioreactor metagenome TaxID=1076179 RepID=A0A644URB0_9ZZZZ|nr:Ni/Fe-hydrogenase cytochrome b subunit [Negativicutes bacterium]